MDERARIAIAVFQGLSIADNDNLESKVELAVRAADKILDRLRSEYERKSSHVVNKYEQGLIDGREQVYRKIRRLIFEKGPFSLHTQDGADRFTILLKQ